jgi:hypothetical protein
MQLTSLSASDLYAQANDTTNDGNSACHWCGSACKMEHLHDDVRPVMFVRNITTAKYVANHWICKGCWLFRRKKITVTFVDKMWQDSQCPQNHSWWITEKEALAIRPPSYAILYDLLLKPPRRFALSLLGDAKENMLHFALANDIPFEVTGETPLVFTIANKPYSYTIYELEEALENGEPEGKEPGVRALIDLLGLPPAKDKVDMRKGTKGGRPVGDPNTPKKVIVKSGAN